MKYETPELTALTAINAIQSGPVTGKSSATSFDQIYQTSGVNNEAPLGYADWE
jgi:hypothetical protein